MTIIGLDSPSVARGGRKHSAMLESLNWHHIYDFFFACHQFVGVVVRWGLL